MLIFRRPYGGHRFTFNMFVFNFPVLIKNNKNPIHSFYTYFKIECSKKEIRGERNTVLRTSTFRPFEIVAHTSVYISINFYRRTINPPRTGGITVGIVRTLFPLVVHILLRQGTDY